MILQIPPQEPLWVRTVLPFLEMLYYLSGVVLAVIAGIALRQLNIAKKDIEIRSRREAASHTALQHDRLVEQIIPLFQELQSAMKDNGISEWPLVNDGVLASFDKSELLAKETRNWLSKTEPVLPLVLTYLNKLDASAVYFLNGIADEELAFPIMARTYCRQVENMRLFITLFESEWPHSYGDIINLYNLWKGRINKLHLENQVADLTSKIRDFSEHKIRPIGTE